MDGPEAVQTSRMMWPERLRGGATSLGQESSIPSFVEANMGTTSVSSDVAVIASSASISSRRACTPGGSLRVLMEGASPPTGRVPRRITR